MERKWLEQLGFKKGEHVQIEQQQDKLTITLCGKEITAPKKSYT